MIKQEAGHIFLAKLGKKRLRPGGKKATNFLLNHLDFNNKEILEVACNMATTAIELAKKNNCRIIGIDLDKFALEKAKHNIIKNNVQDKVKVINANATQLPFDDNSFDVVINEAMLTMHADIVRNKCIEEYYRVLRPGGFLLTHDVALLEKNESLISELSKTINVNVNPVTVNEWLKLFENHNFKIIDYSCGLMTLLNPIGMIRDEGIINIFKIIKNAFKKENFFQFKKMFKFFKSNRKKLNYIAVVSQK